MRPVPSMFDRRLVTVFAMGVASGLPLALSGATLTYWLARVGVDRTAIGLFSMVALSYSLKFLWAPVFDHVPFPVLSTWLGRRRSWLLVTQCALVCAVVFTGFTDPLRAPLTTALGAVCIAFFSASQDIVIDAYRIEILDDEHQSLGATATGWGYRLGMLVSGAGALLVADRLHQSSNTWSVVYCAMAAILALATLVTWFGPEPAPPPPHRSPDEIPGLERALGLRLQEAVIEPFTEFAHDRPWVRILVFLVLFRLGEAIAGAMTMAFYVDSHFTGLEIATVSKVFGVIATVVGVGAGGVLALKLGVRRAMVVAGIAMITSNLGFSWVSLRGHDLPALIVAVCVDNFTGGLAAAPVTAFLSRLCSRKHAATQYALLTSVAVLARTTFGGASGWISKHVDQIVPLAWVHAHPWAAFYALTTVAGIPGVTLLAWIDERTIAGSTAHSDEPARAAARGA